MTKREELINLFIKWSLNEHIDLKIEHILFIVSIILTREKKLLEQVHEITKEIGKGVYSKDQLERAENTLEYAIEQKEKVAKLLDNYMEK